MHSHKSCQKAAGCADKKGIRHKSRLEKRGAECGFVTTSRLSRSRNSCLAFFFFFFPNYHTSKLLQYIRVCGTLWAFPLDLFPYDVCLGLETCDCYPVSIPLPRGVSGSLKARTSVLPSSKFSSVFLRRRHKVTNQLPFDFDENAGSDLRRLPSAAAKRL